VTKTPPLSARAGSIPRTVTVPMTELPRRAAHDLSPLPPRAANKETLAANEETPVPGPSAKNERQQLSWPAGEGVVTPQNASKFRR
jgi:hypothetical protein